MLSHQTFPTLLALVMSLSLCVVSQAQFQQDAKWVPNQANSIILINADRIFSSGIATREDWATTGAGAYERGLSIVPPNVGRVMLASHMDFKFLEAVWTLGVFSNTAPEFTLAELAGRWGSEIEQLDRRNAVELPDDLYVVQLANSSFGIMAPADRQSTIRWLREADAGRSRLSRYMSDAISFADQNADLIIAFDLEHVISVSEARRYLLNAGGVRAADIGAIAEAVSRLRGVILGVTVRDSITGSLRIDFEPGTQGVNRITKALILDAMANYGVMINDSLDWEISHDNNRVVFSGPLSTAGMRKISSLVNDPVRAQFTGGTPQESDASLSIGRSSRDFLDSIDLFFRELDEMVRGPRQSNAKAYARWFDKFANKVDALPINNVDPELVEFAGQVSEGMRDVALILFQAETTARSRTESEVAQNRGTNWAFNNFGFGYRRRANSSIRREIRTQEIGEASVEARGVMNNLRGGLGDMRRQMSSRYSDF